jgi:putative ATP-binding cassette transporter
LIDRWLENDLFRKLQFAVGEDHNPEYRIAEDARIATDAPISMAVGLLKAVLSAAIFIGILWNVGGDLVIGVFGYVLTVPKYLVIAVATYSTVLTLAMTIIGRRLVRPYVRGVSVARPRGKLNSGVALDWPEPSPKLSEGEP